MCDAAEWFRSRLSEMLRTALADRNKEAVSTLRCMMAAIDNAGAISHEEVAKFAASATTEVSRRSLNKQDIAEILQAEIDARNHAVVEYERIGKTAHATRIRSEIALIKNLMTLLH